MGFIIGLLTVVMVLDCAILAILILIQLPKKEAGAGLAFGGAATDALFGAGSGNVLTKIAKYAATIFFVLAISLSAMQSRYHERTTNASKFLNELQQPGPPPLSPSAVPMSGPATTPTAPPIAPMTTGTNQLTAPAAEATNLPAPVTPAPTETKK